MNTEGFGNNRSLFFAPIVINFSHQFFDKPGSVLQFNLLWYKFATIRVFRLVKNGFRIMRK
ncbi:hypothetical protein LH29_13925 [Draconibacterium sediminis]|uniref:Uncharacterized protein n=1 Tax=Draconibacterium sediminis TaxID=1544798 RepID=A0A0D8JC16_9BACT|nr:hypothetical protein LH29_13925 [Draconibacterium sediminis]